MASPEDLRTQFAQRAISIAEAFAGIVGSQPLQGPVAYRVEMVVPEGPSTGGGARSIQHIRIVPIAEKRGNNALVIGACDQIEMTATLRTWELLAEQYAQRFKGAKLPVDAVEYGKLFQRIEDFFRERTMRVDKLDIDRAPSPMLRPAPSSPAAPPKSLSRGAPSVPWVIALLLAGAALGSALTLVLR